jgi:hypothetical protein
MADNDEDVKTVMRAMASYRPEITSNIGSSMIERCQFCGATWRTYPNEEGRLRREGVGHTDRCPVKRLRECGKRVETVNMKATETTTTNQRPLVKDMDEQARIAYLAGLVGKRVRYATIKAAIPLLKAFGQYATIPWTHGVVERLDLDANGKPQLIVRYEQSSNLLGLTFTRDLPRFDDLYDTELDELPPLPSEPDYDGADVYAADEVACPHCGHKLRITQRATVEVVSEEDSERRG